MVHARKCSCVREKISHTMSVIVNFHENNITNNGAIAFYKRYVDNTIVLAKPCDLNRVLKQFNSFHPQIQFTIDQFSNNDIHFLDIQILPNGTTVYRKQNHSGQMSTFLQLHSMVKNCPDTCTYSSCPQNQLQRWTFTKRDQRHQTIYVME